MIPNRCPTEINVEVCVASLHAHETIPVVEKQQQKASLSARKWPTIVAEISLCLQNNSYEQKCQQMITQGTAPGKLMSHCDTCSQWDISSLEINGRAHWGADNSVIEPDERNSICLKASGQCDAHRYISKLVIRATLQVDRILKMLNLSPRLNTTWHLQ